MKQTKLSTFWIKKLVSTYILHPQHSYLYHIVCKRLSYFVNKESKIQTRLKSLYAAQ